MLCDTESFPSQTRGTRGIKCNGILAFALGAGGLANRATGISLNGGGGGRTNVQTPARANLDFSTPAPAASTRSEHSEVCAVLIEVSYLTLVKASRGINLLMCRMSHGPK